jgi:hypothetical protein
VQLAVAELERRARKALARMRGSSVDDSDFMDVCFKAVLDQCEASNSNSKPSSDRSTKTAAAASATQTSAFVIRDRALTDEEFERLLTPRYQVAATICTGCKRGWQHGVGTTLLSPPELERALCDCTDIGDVDDDTPGRATRSIPKAVKRHVFHRDGYKCRVPGCGATANIDCHHMKFWKDGGKHENRNLLTLCEGHHLAVHAGSLLIEGDAVDPKFTWSKQSNFKIETRVVECRAALRARGVAKELIKPAVEATRTHVGQHDLTTAQWIEIALTKLPQEANRS